MRNLKKIIALFLLIFITGTVVTIISINKILDKETSKDTETIKASKDSIKDKSTKRVI
ncbi:MAG: hypothetical protein GKR88_02425 [Flavobacteriaceae bacterium]|nr:MAG: hypothetical protein GKR88_02425 [Flavobacteriaceae bacterium]